MKLYTPSGLRTAPEPAPAPKKPTKKPKAPAKKIDPRFLIAAREVRDRYLERVNGHPLALSSSGKYDVSRSLLKAEEFGCVLSAGAELKQLPSTAHPPAAQAA
ncbi:MAG TPA: hypothetical protein VGR35_06575 [Tepidisphaeraceae bacterium]|nr:hypothetical protein [Tepidisphaeraceae bacterium]